LRGDGVGREHGGVAEVDDPKRLERIHPDFEVRARRKAGRPDSAGPVARARPVGDEVVRRRADDRNVCARELGRILGEDSPIPAEDRAALETVLDRLFEPYRKVLRRRRSA